MEKEERIKILQDILAMKTVDENELEVYEYFKKLFDQHGIKNEIFKEQPGRAAMIAEIGPEDATNILGMSGHADTVAVPDESLWSYPPFEGTVVGNKMFGRGAADMKSGLAAIVIAFIELVESGIKLPGKLRFLGTSGEEYGAFGAYDLTKRGYSKDLSGLILTEETGGNIFYAHTGAINYKIISHGKSVHSSRPKTGINAITNLVKYINIEPHLFDDAPIDPDFGEFVHSLTIIKGGEQINSIPDYAEVYGNIRATKSYPNDVIIKKIEEAVAKLNEETGVDLEFELIHNFVPVGTDKDSDFIKLIQKVGAKHLGQTPELLTMAGGTDASDFVLENSEMPVAIFGGRPFGISHQIDEYIEIDSYHQLIESLKEIAIEYFK